MPLCRRGSSSALGGAETEKMAKSAGKAALVRQPENLLEPVAAAVGQPGVFGAVAGGLRSGGLLAGAGNGADVFLRWLLARLGFGQQLLLPVLVVCILLACTIPRAGDGGFPAA